MSFIADKQTLDDLNIAGKYKPGSIFSLFNRVHTAGGEKLLEFMLYNPLSDAVEINKRSNLFKYFQNRSLRFPFSREQFDIMQNYLNSASADHLLAAGISNLRKQVLGSVVRDQQYAMMQNGLRATIALLNSCKEFFHQLNQDTAGPYLEQVQLVMGILHDKRLGWLPKEKEVQQLPFLRLTRYDHLLKHTLQKELETLTTVIYYLDVYIAVGNVATEKGFTYAHALSKEHDLLSVEALCHPSLNNAVGNTLSLRQDSNLLFLTGANMAGKSTLMKAFGIAVYLAHTGFPVAAKHMQFSVKAGIYSSINVPDNLNMGYSHFYAEVLRVKKVAQEVSSGKAMVVIFDELFKGTNVKDAYDATLAVTEAFSAYLNCFFVISTHIIEVGEALGASCGNIRFVYLPTVMDGSIPRYTYQLENGITTDRQGMIIIENEGILELLYEKNRDQ